MEPAARSEAPNPFSSADVREILERRGWLGAGCGAEHEAWFARAAELLGPHVANAPELEDLLELVFRYDARAVLAEVDAHVVLSRQDAREVIRALANLLLDGRPLNSDRLKEIVGTLKEQMDLRSRELFHPLRLALTGRTGGGELDRVVLLLDQAASLQWSVPVKSARTRILEFCSALD